MSRLNCALSTRLPLLAGFAAAVILLAPGAHADECRVPVCDIPAKLAQFRATFQGQRYEWLLGYTAQARETSDVEALKNLGAFGETLRGLFVELGEEDWMVRAADELSATCLQKLVMAEGSTVDEMIAYYGRLRSDAVRHVVLQGWRARVPAASRARLIELSRFFVAAVAASQSGERWVLEQAAGGVDDISGRLLTIHLRELGRDERVAYFRLIRSDQVRYNLFEGLRPVIESEATPEPFLLDLNHFLLEALADSEGHEAWVPDAAHRAIDLLNQRLLRRASVPAAERAAHFSQLRSGEARMQVLRAWQERVRAIEGRDELLELNRFFLEAIRLSRGGESWVLEAAQRCADEAATVLFRSFILDRDGMIAIFGQITGVQARFDLLGYLRARASAYEGPDSYLLDLSGFLEHAIAQAGGWERWVRDAAVQALEAVNMRLIQRPAIDAERMAGFFRGILSENNRSIIINRMANRARSYRDKASLLGLARFFFLAGRDCEARGYADWLVTSARGAEAAVTAKLSELFPVYEGVYAIETGCSPDPDGDARPSQACGSGFLDRMVFYNSHGASGWQLSLISEATGAVSHWFSDVQIREGATLLAGEVSSPGTLTRLVLRFDPVARTIRGWLLNSDREGYLVIRGRQLQSTEPVYDAQAARPATERVTLDDLAGELSGTYGAQRARLRVRAIESGSGPGLTATLGGTLAFDGTSLRLHFHDGRLNPETGILTLTSFDVSGHRLKLVLGVRRGADGGVRVSGVSMKTNTTRMLPVELAGPAR